MFLPRLNEISESGKRLSRISSFTIDVNCPNQSLDTLISLTFPSSIWRFGAFPYIWAVRKATKLENKPFIFQTCTLNPNGIDARFSFNLLLILFFIIHIPTNGVAPFLHTNILTTHNFSNHSVEGLALETLTIFCEQKLFFLSC